MRILGLILFITSFNTFAFGKAKKCKTELNLNIKTAPEIVSEKQFNNIKKSLMFYGYDLVKSDTKLKMDIDAEVTYDTVRRKERRVMKSTITISDLDNEVLFEDTRRKVISEDKEIDSERLGKFIHRHIYSDIYICDDYELTEQDDDWDWD